MWEQALHVLRCVTCKGRLVILSPNEPLELPCSTTTGPESESNAANGWLDSGALLCHTCRHVYPIHAGVPICLPYRTALSERAHGSWPVSTRDQLASAGYNLPAGLPPRGERLVGRSFSNEWADYDYGRNLWTASTEDRLKTFRGECGLESGALRGKLFCEIGCGLGITTQEAATSFGGEAWGVDLSHAVLRAAKQYRSNSDIHFVQASVFALPFEHHQFDFVYSHGALHHTYSTQRAVEQAAELLRETGTFYVWLYGLDDVHIDVTRRIAYAFEALTRPALSRVPHSLATAALLPLLPLYQIASVVGQRRGTHAHRYTLRQALHAARDRFTPLYAHRHHVSEVYEWFKNLGFVELYRVKGDDVASSWRTAIDRNVAVRGRGRRPRLSGGGK